MFRLLVGKEMWVSDGMEHCSLMNLDLGHWVVYQRWDGNEFVDVDRY